VLPAEGHTENHQRKPHFGDPVLLGFSLVVCAYDFRDHPWGGIMKRIAIYFRVSTSRQDTDNQRRELEAVAKRSGWHVVRVFEGTGISGAKGRDKPPGLDAMLKAVNAKEFDMVAASVDRLGRSLTVQDAEQIASAGSRLRNRSTPLS
jgi:predicted site-specific integrase-resolvase